MVSVLVGPPQIARRRLGAFEIELDIGVFLGDSHPTVQLDTGAGAEEGGIPAEDASIRAASASSRVLAAPASHSSATQAA